MLAALGATVADASAPEVLAVEIMTMIDPQHAFLINRNKLGSMVLAGESLFVLEMQPASYAILAVNEAEKAARIKVVDYRMIGATGPGVPVRVGGGCAAGRGRGRGRPAAPAEPGSRLGPGAARAGPRARGRSLPATSCASWSGQALARGAVPASSGRAGPAARAARTARRTRCGTGWTRSRP